MMTVYGDILFAVHMGVNLLLLAITARIMGCRWSMPRVVFASAIGASLTLIGLVSVSGVIAPYVGRALVPVVMLPLAFGLCPIPKLLLRMVCFYSVSFWFGGASIAWSALSGRALGNPVISVADLTVGAILVVMLVYSSFRKFEARLLRSSLRMTVRLELKGRSIEVTGFIDTGNSLRSWRGFPVILIEQSALGSLLSDEAAAFLKRTPANDWLTSLCDCPDLSWLSRVEAIPCTSIGGEKLLLGFRPDRFLVSGKGGFLTEHEVRVAIIPGRLSASGDYSALLHPAFGMSQMNKEVIQECA